jgi:hypothetical protein
MKRMIRAVMLALTLGCFSPWAQAADAQTPVQAVRIGQTLGATPSGTFDLSFSGGPPQKLISEMEKASGQKLNALIPAELTDVSIPPMELRSVQVQGVFDSLNMLWRNSMLWLRPSSGASGYGMAPGQIPGQPGSGQNIWVLTRSPDSRKTQAFYVGHLLKKFKIDDITTAVQTTWQLGGKEAKAELKYHQDTQLLIALGHPEQLSTAAEVLAQLKLAVEPTRIEPGKTDDAKSPDNKKGKSATQP